MTYSRPPIVEPVVTQEKGETTVRHPAFAQISVNRVSGGAMLYGSDFAHHNYVTIRIRGSSLRRHLSHDWPRAEEELIEISMSESQWAQLICTPNTGEGTQCTLNRVVGQDIPRLPTPVSRHDQFAKENAQHVADAMEAIENAVSLVAQSGLSKSKQADILSALRKASQDIGVNQDYVAKCFSQYMEDTTQKARVELSVWASQLMSGLDMKSSQHPLQLPIDGLIVDPVDKAPSDVSGAGSTE